MKRLEQIYMGEQKEIEEMNQTQHFTPWLVKTLFCYEGDKHTGNKSERKQHFLQHKGKHSSSKEAYTGGSKSTGRKVGYAVFTDTTPPKEGHFQKKHPFTQLK